MMQNVPITSDPSTDLPPSRAWRPWPITAPFLAFFSALCVFSCVIIEFIVRGCSATGCHIFGASSSTRLSQGSYFVYNLLPTILGVCFGLLWATVHHDVLRLEPYFQMSTSEGALAANSILLDYPYRFPLFVPLIAWKRRHYVVFLSSCILLTTNFLITPLASGLFDDSILMRNVTSETTRGALKAKEGQPSHFSTSFAYAAYNYQWLNGSFPQFTTPEYALLPVQEVGSSLENETWTAKTILFEAELQCEDAIITRTLQPGSDRVAWNITSSMNDEYSCILWEFAWGVAVTCGPIAEEFGGFGSSLNSTVFDDHGYEFIDFTSAWTGIARAIGGNTSETTMYAWASSAEPKSTSPFPTNITAIFCQPSYYSQLVNATFTMPSGDITHVNRTGARTPFTAATGFARIFNGNTGGMFTVPEEYKDSANNIVGLGFRPEMLPDLESQIRRYLGPNPQDMAYSVDASTTYVYMPNSYRLPAFAMYNKTRDTLGEMLDPQVLAATYQSTLQQLFALAVTLELVDDKAGIPAMAIREIRTKGFTVNGLWARGAQGGLVVAAVLVLVLGALSHKRRCELDGEPNSLAAVLQLLASSEAVCAETENAEFHTEEELRTFLDVDSRRYQLVLLQGTGPMINLLGPGIERPGLQDRSDPWMQGKLWILRTATGVVLVGLFVFTFVVLLGVFGYALRENGLPSFGDSTTFRYKVVFSYIPLFIGMAAEPILVSIGSCHCMLAPYETLRRAPTESKYSLAIEYDRSPPHFQLGRSLRSANIVLAALSAAILLANVLAVTISGLFSPSVIEYNSKGGITVPKALRIIGELPNQEWDMIYALEANFSMANDLPTWTTPDFFVAPFFPVDSKHTQVYRGETFGIGLDIKCSVFNGQNVTGVKSDSRPGYIIDFGPLANLTNATNGYTANPITGPSDDRFILKDGPHRTFLVIWADLIGGLGVMDAPAQTTRYFNVVGLECTATDAFYHLTATMNRAYQVLSTSDIRPLDAQEIDSLFSESSSYPGALAANFFVTAVSQSRVESIAGSNLFWQNYFMATLKPSIIRHAPNLTHLPDTTDLAAAYEDVSRRLFAIKVRLNHDDIFSTGNTSVVQGMVTVQRNKVQVNKAMSILTAIIMLFIIVALVLLYWQKPRVFGHLPTSLAGMYALLYASNAKDYCGRGSTPEERAKTLVGTYRYGNFNAGDGKRHFGVYRESEEATYPAMTREEKGSCN